MDTIAGMELSTQLLAIEARRRGVGVEVLDADDNFLRLTRAGRTDYVKQATRTAADPYIAALIMENKEVTKRVLRDHGLPVPAGFAVKSVEAAAALWERFAGQGVVVKPRSTKFGEGVVVFKDESWRRGGSAAVARALELDSVALIEEFVPGPEYRFLVVGDETVAVLHRVPANVTGDGVRSIRALVEEKNRDPRRGSGYVTSLEKIRLGVVEDGHLRAQGLDFDSVPVAGRMIFLRENSNISTGGDSLDFTDAVHAGYKEAAVRAARAVGARICGADLIIPDIQAAPGRYSIIELNFNPALHIHDFPFVGKNRRVEGKVLDLLGFPAGAIEPDPP
jgi:glutamate--cysteine ligase